MGYVFKLEIQANGAAFGITDQSRLAEIARCLRVAADQCQAGAAVGSIHDAHRRTAGTFVLADAPCLP